MKNYKIRVAEKNDIISIHKLNNDFLPEKYSLEQLNKHFMKHPFDNFVCFIDEEKNKEEKNEKEENKELIVGYLIINSTKNELISICVHENHRRKKIGTELIKTYWRERIHKKYVINPFLNLYVRISNKPAINFYFRKLNGTIEFIEEDFYPDGESAFFIRIQCLNNEI